MKKKTNIVIRTQYLIGIIFFCLFYTLNINAQEWQAPKEADQISNPLSEDLKAIEKGRKIYYQICALCHGRSGKGDGPNAKTLSKQPADHTSDLIQNQSDGALYWKISKGKDPMPSYNEVFSKTQRWQIIAFIRTLKDNR